jgi:hypothetical protein
VTTRLHTTGEPAEAPKVAEALHFPNAPESIEVKRVFVSRSAREGSPRVSSPGMVLTLQPSS